MYSDHPQRSARSVPPEAARDDRIMELLRLEKTFKITESTHWMAGWLNDEGDAERGCSGEPTGPPFSDPNAVLALPALAAQPGVSGVRVQRNLPPP